MLDRQYFFDLLVKKLSGNTSGLMKTNNLIKHCLATEICLRDLADFFGEDREVWGLAGLMHDADCAECDDIKDQGIKIGKELAGLGVAEEIIHAIGAHNKSTGTPRISLLDKAIFAVDPTTGLIVSATLVLPSKKISDLSLESLLKRVDEKRFAAGANREAIRSCSEIRLSLEQFMKVCLEAMKKISGELGL